MLPDRQLHLLRLLNLIGGQVGATDLQKLLFLSCQESAVAWYEFVPYRFGAFSFTSYDDLRKLGERGLVNRDDLRVQLTELGRAAIGPGDDPRLQEFTARYRGLRGDALVAETYRRYPATATRSVIAERVLSGDTAALECIAAKRPKARPGTLVTIGYQGRTLERYLNDLLAAGVTLLCDVRRNPLSRKYGFSKKTLARGCEGVGLRYEHLPQLGIASEQRQGLRTQRDYDELFAAYERDSLPGEDVALACIADWVRAGECVALTCFELLSTQCHRRCVSTALERRLGAATRHL